ncbi:hypothetical protein Ddc_23714 [Ditylenchus destructor]|nr:hypothetical protein Ddc_23714 [Ditylenchus destructor]
MATGAIPAQIDFEHGEKDKSNINDKEISMPSVYAPPDSYYYTCCGKVHVEKAAIWIAILAYLFHCMAVFQDIFSRMFHIPSHYHLSLDRAPDAVQLCIIFFGVASYVCIPAAHKKRIARLYWPFLVYNGLMLAGVGITAARMVNYTFLGESLSNSVPTFVIIGSAFAQFLIFAWMELIINKAYKYMVNHGNGNNNRMMHFNNQMYFDDSMKV